MTRIKKPRLLLINPWIYDFSAYDFWSKPIGLLYVAAYLRKIGYEIDFIDCLDRHHPFLSKKKGEKRTKLKKYGTGHFYRERVEKPAVLNFVPRHFSRYGLPEDVFLAELTKRHPPEAVLVTSLMTYWYPGPQRVVELVRQIFPGVPLILGGIYATLMAQHAWQVIRPDYLVTGPGEVQIANLLSEILTGAPKHNRFPESLDHFPPPALDLYSKLDYLIVMSSRGCPYHCTFCATDQISGGYVQRKPGLVVEEILEGVRKFGVQDVAFYDDALLLNKESRIIPILHALLHGKINLQFHTPNGLHARQIDPELARLFFENNFRTIQLSFESSSPDRQQDMKGKVSPNDLENAVRYLEKAGYQRKSLSAYVLFGLPNQPLEEVYESILFVNSLGIKVNLASFSPIPGTVDYQRAVETGLFPEDADPLLTNNSIYPLHRQEKAYWQFQRIRQFVQMLNDGNNRGIGLTSPPELRTALRKMLNNWKDD